VSSMSSLTGNSLFHGHTDLSCTSWKQTIAFARPSHGGSMTVECMSAQSHTANLFLIESRARDGATNVSNQANVGRHLLLGRKTGASRSGLLAQPRMISVRHVVQKLLKILGPGPLACEHACLCADGRINQNSHPAFRIIAA